MRKLIMIAAASVLISGLAACDETANFPQPEVTVTGSPTFNGKCTKVMIEKDINGCGDGIPDAVEIVPSE